VYRHFKTEKSTDTVSLSRPESTLRNDGQWF